jgi:ankyrin repeat protein
VQALLERGANPNAVSKRSFNGDTMLMAAIRRGDTSAVEQLLAHGADVHATNSLKVDALRFLILGRPSDVRSGPWVVQMLIDHGAASDAVDDAPLYIAAQSGSADVLHYLLLNGANVHYRPGDHLRSVLGIASAWDAEEDPRWNTVEQERKVRLLLAAGAESDAPDALKFPDTFLKSVLEDAQKSGHAAEHAWEIVDERGNGQLHYAAGMGDPHLTQKLLGYGLDVNASSQGAGEWSMGYDAGASALHVAAAHCYPEVVAQLVAKRARIDARDTKGRTPAQVACTLEPFDHAMPVMWSNDLYNQVLRLLGVTESASAATQ